MLCYASTRPRTRLSTSSTTLPLLLSLSLSSIPWAARNKRRQAYIGLPLRRREEEKKRKKKRPGSAHDQLHTPESRPRPSSSEQTRGWGGTPPCTSCRLSPSPSVQSTSNISELTVPRRACLQCCFACQPPGLQQHTPSARTGFRLSPGFFEPVLRAWRMCLFGMAA